MKCKVLESHTNESGVMIEINHWRYNSELVDIFVSVCRPQGEYAPVKDLYHIKADTITEAQLIFEGLKERIY